MLVCDVNVLIATYRADHPHHSRVRPWWLAALQSGERIHVPDIAWVAFLRIVSNPRVFAVPSSMSQACDFADAVRAHPAYSVGWVSPATFEEFTRRCREDHVTGNLVTEAWIAATATIMGAPVVTLDRDFRRFDGLSIVEPGTPPA